MSAADWELLGRNASPWPKPRRDLIATDGQRLTLVDTTLTLYLTPGHTPGTISTLIPVTDGGKSHLAAAQVPEIIAPRPPGARGRAKVAFRSPISARSTIGFLLESPSPAAAPRGRFVGR